MKNIIIIFVSLIVSLVSFAGNKNITTSAPLGCYAFHTGDSDGQFAQTYGKNVQRVYLRGSTSLKKYFYKVLKARRHQYALAYGETAVSVLEENEKNPDLEFCLSYGSQKNSGVNDAGDLCGGSNWEGHWISVIVGDEIINLAKYANFYHKTKQTPDNYCYNAADYDGELEIEILTPKDVVIPECNFSAGTAVAFGDIVTLQGAVNSNFFLVDGVGEKKPIAFTTWTWSGALPQGTHTLWVYGCTNQYPKFVTVTVNKPTPTATCKLEDGLGDSFDPAGNKWKLTFASSKGIYKISEISITKFGVKNTDPFVITDNNIFEHVFVQGETEVSFKVTDTVAKCSKTFSRKVEWAQEAPRECFLGLTMNCSCDSATLSYSGPGYFEMKGLRTGTIKIDSGQKVIFSLGDYYTWEIKTPGMKMNVVVKVTQKRFLNNEIQDLSLISGTAKTISPFKDCIECGQKKGGKGIGWWILGGTLLLLGGIAALFGLGTS